MTERKFAAGAGGFIRRSYARNIVVGLVALAFVTFLPLLSAARMARGAGVLTVALGTAATFIAFGLLFTALLRGRAAVSGDTIELTRMRSSGRLALAAQIAGLAGIVVTAVLGLLHDAGWALPLSALLALAAASPVLIGNAVRRSARALTSDRAPP